jgi:cytochrome c
MVRCIGEGCISEGRGARQAASEERRARMNSSELNKIMAAVLVAGITFMVTGIIGQALVHPKRLETAAIKIEVAAPATTAAAPPALAPIAPLMAEANAENGQRIARQQCGACHNFAQGGPNGVGPNLYAILGAPHAHAAGFNYSPVLVSMKDKPWDYENLNAFLAAPRTYAPGTRMGYAGLASPAQRADVIAYLRSLDANPKPLPEVTAAPVAAAAPAAGAAPVAAAPAAPPPPAAAPAPAAGGSDIAVRLASADVAAGEARAKILCAACHTFTQGGRNGVGPNLWNAVGAQRASHEGFNYSAGLKGKPGEWTFEELDKWLAAPMTYAPGTRMPIGTPDPVVRANIIAWLRTLAENPKPLP